MWLVTTFVYGPEGPSILATNVKRAFPVTIGGISWKNRGQNLPKILYCPLYQGLPAGNLDLPLPKLIFSSLDNHITINKYAIHAYTHGPVTGSGHSVKPLKNYVTPLLVELRVLVPPPSLIQPM